MKNKYIFSGILFLILIITAFKITSNKNKDNELQSNSQQRLAELKYKVASGEIRSSTSSINSKPINYDAVKLTNGFRADQFIRKFSNLTNFSSKQDFGLIYDNFISQKAIDALKLNEREVIDINSAINVMHEKILIEIEKSLEDSSNTSSNSTLYINHARSPCLNIMEEFNNQLVSIIGHEKAALAIANMHLDEGPLSYGMYNQSVDVVLSDNNSIFVKRTRFGDDGKWIARDTLPLNDFEKFHHFKIAADK